MRWFLVYVAVCLVLALWIVDQKAYAHKAQSGWEYPKHCCDENDCSEVIGEPKYTPDGMYVILTNKFGTARCPISQIKPSQDEKWHACIVRNFEEEYSGGGNWCVCSFAPPLY